MMLSPSESTNNDPATANPDEMVREESQQFSSEQPRLSLKPENVEKGMAQLVLTLIDLLRQLMEKQALRRMETGELTDEQIERMGQTFAQLETKLHEFMDYFDLTEDDLNINLGPLGDLL
jgi:hypothetical protein